MCHRVYFYFLSCFDQDSEDNKEDRMEGTVDWKVYLSYYRAGVGIPIGILVLIFLAITRVGSNFDIPNVHDIPTYPSRISINYW